MKGTRDLCALLSPFVCYKKVFRQAHTKMNDPGKSLKRPSTSEAAQNMAVGCGSGFYLLQQERLKDGLRRGAGAGFMLRDRAGKGEIKEGGPPSMTSKFSQT